ncbi:MAG: ATP-binding protein, partial [Proteobacteria bacterium]|nr:ATP-binding protein [Pseudomonadota bacterium]
HYLRRIIDVPTEQLRPNQRHDWLTLGYQWVFVDFQDPRMCYQESLLRHILIELDMPIPEPCDLIGFMEIIDQYLETPSLILLDEIGAGLASPDLDEQFWWGMRSLGSNHAGGKLGFLFTAHQPPEEMIVDDNKPSPFFNIFGHVLNLGPFTESEARDLINSSPKVFSDIDVEWILAKSGYWPALLQILCHSRLTALEENQDNWQVEAIRRIKPYLYLLQQ